VQAAWLGHIHHSRLSKLIGGGYGGGGGVIGGDKSIKPFWKAAVPSRSYPNDDSHRVSRDIIVNSFRE